MVKNPTMTPEKIAKFREENAHMARWQEANWARIKREQRPVEMVHYRTIPEVAMALKGLRTKPHDCHFTAWEVACRLSDAGHVCHVVQGLARRDSFPGQRPIEHTWNVFDGRHFDLQSQRRNEGLTDYHSIRTFTLKEYSILISDLGIVEWWLPRLWAEEALEKAKG